MVDKSFNQDFRLVFVVCETLLEDTLLYSLSHTRELSKKKRRLEKKKNYILDKNMKLIISIICLILSFETIRTQAVPPSAPHINTDCGQNSTFKRCLTRCPVTCSNYSNPPKGCVRNCAIGCECHQGFIKVDKGAYSQCVRPFECALYGKKPAILAKNTTIL
ncbi:unnamed protein product, partial [Medioppia subpectinata]